MGTKTAKRKPALKTDAAAKGPKKTAVHAHGATRGDDKTLRAAIDAAWSVRAQLEKLVSEVLQDDSRVRDWVYRLGLDKSLASRTLRVLRAQTDDALVQDMPAEAGLGLVVDAFLKAGATAKRADAVTKAIEAMENATQRVPGGRAGLRSAMSAMGGSVRASVERDARRMTFQSWATLTGTWMTARYSLYVLMPSKTAGALDVGMVFGMAGIHRVRNDKPMVLFSMNASPALDAPKRMLLDESPLGDDPTACIMDECSSYVPKNLQLYQRDLSRTLLLDSDNSLIDESTDLAFGIRYREFLHARRTPENAYLCLMQAIRRPAERLIVDVMMAPGVYEGVEPEAVFNVATVEPRDYLRGPRHAATDTVDLDEKFESMGTGFSRRGTPEADLYNPWGLSAFARMKLSPDSFRRYRLDMRYPIPLLGVDIWFKLPE